MIDLKMDHIGKTFFSAFSFLFSFNAAYARAVDTIFAGQALSSNRTIVSDGGIFELGFFTRGNSQNYYIQIWYKNISKRAVVWVPNRDKPISTISTSEGNLVLIQSQILVLLSNAISLTSGYTVALLLDSGIFVLRNITNSSDVLWQSFDHPN